MSESCLRDTPGTFKIFLTKEILNFIDGGRRARLGGESGRYRQLEREVVSAVKRDEKRRRSLRGSG